MNEHVSNARAQPLTTVPLPLALTDLPRDEHVGGVVKTYCYLFSGRHDKSCGPTLRNNLRAPY